jgi:DNA-binding NarL/FixJ family response regulator
VLRALIVDDHDIARHGLESIIASDDAIEVVASVSRAREAVDLIRSQDVDVVLMDLRLPDMDGLTATRLIKQAAPKTAVLVVTAYGEQSYREQALRAGADGYVLKETPRDALLQAIRRAASGDIVVTERSAERISEPLRPRVHVTPRERAVLRLLAQGLSNIEIANTLALSPNTVQNYVVRILSKLEAPNRAAAVAKALAFGLI